MLPDRHSRSRPGDRSGEMARDPEAYWDRAGAVGYGEAMFADAAVEAHGTRRRWRIAGAIGLQWGLEQSVHVLDLGCGDGAFANRVLAAEFAAVDGFDLSEAGIRRATAEAPGPQVRFRHCDLTRLDFATLPRYDGAFLIGI